MKPSSTDPPIPPAGTDAVASGAIPRQRAPEARAAQRVPDPDTATATAGIATAARTGAGDAPVIRVVSFDRPLQAGAARNLGWADPVVEQRIDEAIRRAREQAHSLGYAAGWAQGQKAAAEREQADRLQRIAEAAEALQDQRIRIRTLLETLGEAARRTALAAVPAWTDVADVIADGAMAIARAALGRELAAVDAEAADAVRTALRTLASVDEVTVQIHPADLTLVRELIGGELPEHVHLAADPGVPLGGVVAATPVQRLRRDLPTAVARAEEVLRS